MRKVIVNEASANYNDDQKVADSSKVIEVGYTREDDEIFINIDIADRDHFITLGLDRDDLMRAITESLLNPEDE